MILKKEKKGNVGFLGILLEERKDAKRCVNAVSGKCEGAEKKKRD